MPFYTNTIRQKNRFFLLSEPSPDITQAHRRLRFLLSLHALSPPPAKHPSPEQAELALVRKSPAGLSNSREHGKTFPRQPQAPVFRSHAAKKTLLPRNRRYGNKNGKRPGFLKGRQPLPRRHRFRKFAWPRKKPSLSPASLSGALYLGLYIWGFTKNA